MNEDTKWCKLLVLVSFKSVVMFLQLPDRSILTENTHNIKAVR